MVVEYANAKINLYLDVLRKRNDGFHDILSVMREVSLCDKISVTARSSSDKRINLKIIGASLPSDRENIVYRAAELYMDKSQICSEINVEIEKNIPIGAGLAGGSSDAAATLRALNKIYSRFNGDELLDLASELGSDVPFCLMGGAAVCEGRGEKMTELGASALHLVIAIGNIRVNTSEAYAKLDEKYDNFSDTEGSERRFAEFFKAYGMGDLRFCLYNIFEDVSDVGVTNLKNRLLSLCATAALMSGSGPSVFGIFESAESAKRACEQLKKEGYTAFCASGV